MPKRPFESVSADLFTLGGKHFLVYVDRMSGYPKIAQWRDDPSSSQVAYEIRQFFVDLGVPKRFRSDGGMQFAAASFRKFLERWGVEWVPSTPHFPSGNGHAECNVKLLKNLLAKMQTPEIRNEEFQEALLELRNTPRNDGLSPNAIVFGNNLRSRVPAHHTSFDSKWQTAAEELDKKFAIRRKKIHDHYNSTARDLKPLRVGDKVRVQDHATKRWDKIGDIVGVGENRDYRIKLPSGRTWWRNRRFLRRYNGEIEDAGDDTLADNEDDDEPTTTAKPTNENVQLRRSARESKKTVRFGINQIILIR